MERHSCDDADGLRKHVASVITACHFAVFRPGFLGPAVR